MQIINILFKKYIHFTAINLNFTATKSKSSQESNLGANDEVEQTS